MEGLRTREDFHGPIGDLQKLANEKGLTPREMLSTVARGREGIKEHLSRIKEQQPVVEHKSMLDEFQL